MHYVNVWLTAKDPKDAPKISDLLAEACRLSRQEEDCERFEVYHSKNDPSKFLLCEWWRSEQAHQAHRERTAYTSIYQPLVLPLVDREPHISLLVVE